MTKVLTYTSKHLISKYNMIIYIINMVKVELTERDEEKQLSTKDFHLNVPFPNKHHSKDKDKPTKEKTALYVPRNELVKNNLFKSSSFSPKVKVTRNVTNILETIFKYGNIAKRYGENGLEMDPTRQQIIIYSVIVCQNNLLWYQRATPETAGTDRKKFLGDLRLQGKQSVGFGGHKTEDDIGLSNAELTFLQDLLPAIKDQLAVLVGLNKGFFTEIEEELGINRGNIKDIKFLGAFFDERLEDPSIEIQVGWVHTGIATIIELDPETTTKLHFHTRETAKAWWVPFDKVFEELNHKMKVAQQGKGPLVESWTETMIKEFWSDYYSK